jgi:chemotaxis family two-component system sensor kinase Cph1
MDAAKPATGVSGMDLGDFILRACHDLRGPLRTITVQAELLSRGVEGARLDWVVENAAKIGQLADGLAGYAIALQTEQASFVTVRMDLMLRLVLAKLAEEVRARNAEVTFDELPRVWGDQDRLMQALEHLILNGLRHRGESPPRVHLSARLQGEDWLLGVRDNGPGIEPQYLDKLFTPLERLRGYEQSGAGMGLAICRAIIERHGGTIWGESQPGSGITFLFTLRAD